jgi:Homeodomain-like domain
MVEVMSKYKATVERDGRFWMVTVEGVGATQARRLGELEAMTVDLIEVMTDDAHPDVDYDYRLPEEVDVHVQAAVRLRHEAAHAQSEAAVEIRAAAVNLHDQGIPLRDIGRLLGVSYQRAHQLVSARVEHDTNQIPA